MNFFLPKPTAAVWELMQRPAFYVVIGLLLVIPVLMYRWMRNRTWV